MDLELSGRALDHRGRRGGGGAPGLVRGGLLRPAAEAPAPAPAGAASSASNADGIPQRYARRALHVLVRHSC